MKLYIFQLHSLTNGASIKTEDDLISLGFEDLERLDSCSSSQDVEKAIKKYSTALQSFIKCLECNNYGTKGTMVCVRNFWYEKAVRLIIRVLADIKQDEPDDTESLGGPDLRARTRKFPLQCTEEVRWVGHTDRKLRVHG